MNDVMGIIYTSKDDLTMRELTSQRAVAAIPVAGRYRIIDFTLSNLVNSGVRNVGVIAQKNYHSLMDHIGSGKEWDLHTRSNGLFILPPFLTRENGGEYSGVVEALRANFDYLRRSQQKYAILTNSDYIMNTSFEPMIRQHVESGADITLMYKKVAMTDLDYSRASNNAHALIDIDEENIVRDMEVNPNAASFDNLFLDILLVKRTLLIHLIDQAVAHGAKSLDEEVLRPFIRSGALKVMAYRMDGYYRRIETIKSYFNFNLDLLNYDVRKELFGTTPVYTKTKCPRSTARARRSRIRWSPTAASSKAPSKTAFCSAASTSRAAPASRTASSCRTAISKGSSSWKTSYWTRPSPCAPTAG